MLILVEHYKQQCDIGDIKFSLFLLLLFFLYIQLTDLFSIGVWKDMQNEEIPVHKYLFVCVEVLRPSQPNGVMSSMISLPNHTCTGQA